MFPLWQMPTPTAYGWFHLGFILFAAFILAFLLCRSKKKGTHSIQKVVLGIGIFTLLMELYKQGYLLSNFSYYSFNEFPLHYCSMIIYASLIGGLAKNKKVQQRMFDFIALFLAVPAVSVLIYPGGVFSTHVLLNLHTMIWHSSMVVCSLYVLLVYPIRPAWKRFFKTMGFFILLCGVILLINTFTYHVRFLPQNQATHFFFIGPYLFYQHPVIQWAVSTGGFPLYLLLYLATFSFGAFLFTLLNVQLYKKKKKEQL